MTTRIVSVLPEKAEKRLADLIASGSSGSFIIRVHEGRILKCEITEDVKFRD
jgi:hypothetical protein